MIQACAIKGVICLFQLDLKSRKSIYEQVVDNLREQIIKGLLKPEEKLPSVRDLSRILTINPNTIQKAYRQLESLGYVYTVSGVGTFAVDAAHIPKDARKIDEARQHLRAGVMELLYLGVSAEETRGILMEILEERGDGI